MNKKEKKLFLKKDFMKLLLLLIALFLVFGIVVYFYGKMHRVEEPINVSKVENQIEKYGYSINNNASDYYKNEFEILKEMSLSDSINDEDVASQVGKLYVIDLLSLNNKINKYEVTSSQYFFSDKRDMNTQKIIDNFYNLIVDETYVERDQELPEVREVAISKVSLNNYKLGDNKVESYELLMDVSYVRDMGYDKKIKVIVVKDNNNFSVVNYENAE